MDVIITKPELNKEYTYQEIEKWCMEENGEINEYGEGVIGKNIIHISDSLGVDYIFVLSGYVTAHGNLYKLVNIQK